MILNKEKINSLLDYIKLETSRSNEMRINADRLWKRIHSMSKIGATPLGGVKRLALSQEDKLARDLLLKWGKEIGCSTRIDAMGNIFIRLEGVRKKAPPILFGSHLDSQPTGGKYDGTYGVLAGFEIIETITENDVIPEFPLELVSWTSEEGARFSPAMISSGVFGGVFPTSFAYSLKDQDGIELESALKAIGYKGPHSPFGTNYSGFFELHIEQGPILQDTKKSIGIVKGVQGIRWYELNICGQEVHAGPFPMHMRKDPVSRLPKLLQELYGLVDSFGPETRITIGSIKTDPGIQNTVPKNVKISIDIRQPEQIVLNQMHEFLMALVRTENDLSDLDISIEEIWHCAPIQFDSQCIKAVSKSVKSLNLSSLEMISGAGHDAAYVSKVVPTAMIFIPCKDGISHNENESITQTDATNGANVLLHTIIEYISYLKTR